MEFYKYQGTGNDFILIDDSLFSFPEEDYGFVKALCDRRFGIGADGLMLLRKHPNYDFEMIYYNSDGNKSTMCGNGGRCIVAFSHFRGWIADKARFLAVDGPHSAELNDNQVTLSMIDVKSVQEHKEGIYLDTGSPHLVKFIQDAEALDVKREGHTIRYSLQYAPAGTNVNFVEQISPEEITVRTYERGVEDETLSCGTGVVASAIASFLRTNDAGISSSASYNVNTPGGKLIVQFSYNFQKQEFTDVRLIGPAEQVFQRRYSCDFSVNFNHSPGQAIANPYL